jgi:arabinoxylan arabinofuranohydrolase
MLITLFSIAVCLADNPIVQTVYTADPAPMVYNGVCYLYTGHDADVTVNNFYTMNDWRCFSSTDMVNWTDLGSPLSYTAFSWAKGDCWAGQCVYRNGKFYYYVPMTQKTGGMAIGVAVATSPAGPFTDALGKPLIAHNGSDDIDPTVFIDDDGQAYLYWGHSNLYYVKLNQDMITYSGSVVQVSSKPSNYVEGPFFYKRNGLYYLVFATIPNPSEDLAYSTSTSPTGPWTYRGIIMAHGSCYTNQAGICDYNGNSYLFYHNNNLPGGGSFTRSVCLEKFTYNADGSIPTINMTPSGPPQIGSLNPYVQTEAETICWSSGLKTEVCSEGGRDVSNIENGDYLKVKGVNFGSGATSLDARVASATSGGNIEIHLDSLTGTLVGTCVVQGSGGWQTWVTKSCTISGATGIHDVYFKFIGGSGYLLNFNWWKFNSGTSSSGGTYARFRNAATGLYIDGMGSTANGSNACQWGNSNSNNQQWTIINSGSYGMIQNRATGLYLDGMGNTANGSVCGQLSYSGSNAQQWAEETSGSYVRFKNRQTGLYLDGMGSTGNGSNLCQWSNSASTNQQWQIQQIQ